MKFQIDFKYLNPPEMIGKWPFLYRKYAFKQPHESQIGIIWVRKYELPLSHAMWSFDKVTFAI